MQALLEHFILRSALYSLIAVLLVAFLESLALVGLILPGTVMMAGLGALIGLSSDWRADSYFVAEHLSWLERHHWQSRYSLSFPRLRPCTGGLQPEVVMSDRQLVQLICAWRLFSPTLELSLSTRESPAFRNGALRLGITQMSAESRTQPGMSTSSMMTLRISFA